MYVLLLVLATTYTARAFSFIYHFCSGVILEKDGSKSDDENETKKKSRAAGPLEIVRKSL